MGEVERERGVPCLESGVGENNSPPPKINRRDNPGEWERLVKVTRRR